MDEETKKYLFQMVKRNKYMQMINLELTEADEGYARGRIRVDDTLLNPNRTVHGGCLYSAADIIAGIAASAYGNKVCTVSGSMNYVNPACNTEYVYCEATEVRQGNHLGVYDVRMTNDMNGVIETGSFTYYNLNERVDADGN
jgi:acyl-CoA thioesterase